MAERWKADDAHRKAAQTIENAVSGIVFDEFDDVCRAVKRHYLNAVSGAPALDVEIGEESDLYGQMVWPLLLTDQHGRRFEIEVDVSVRPLPDEETERAQRQRDMKRFGLASDG